MTPAQQVHRRKAVETALTRLAYGQRYNRKALFGKSERWQDTLLAKLERMGAVEVERGKRANIYQASKVNNYQAINQLLNNEESFLTLVFPSQKNSAQDADALATLELPFPSHTNYAPDADEPPPEDELESDALATLELPQYSGEALQEAQLQMLAGIAQLLGQLDARMAVVEADTAAIRKALLE
jgi:hypothetical protein